VKRRAATYVVLVAAVVALKQYAAQKETVSQPVQPTAVAVHTAYKGRQAGHLNGARSPNGHLVRSDDSIADRLEALAKALPEDLRSAVYEDGTYRELLEEEVRIWERYGIPPKDRTLDNAYRPLPYEASQNCAQRIKDFLDLRVRMSLALSALIASRDTQDAIDRCSRFMTSFKWMRGNGKAD
jgi:hypothetical protein